MYVCICVCIYIYTHTHREGFCVRPFFGFFKFQTASMVQCFLKILYWGAEVENVLQRARGMPAQATRRPPRCNKELTKALTKRMA